MGIVKSVLKEMVHEAYGGYVDFDAVKRNQTVARSVYDGIETIIKKGLFGLTKKNFGHDPETFNPAIVVTKAELQKVQQGADAARLIFSQDVKRKELYNLYGFSGGYPVPVIVK